MDSAFEQIENFIADLQLDVSTLERQTKRDDPLTVASVAYRLKGHAKALGIDLVYQSAVQIETSARKNRMGQLSAEIDLLRYQVELLSQSAILQRNSSLYQATCPNDQTASL